MNADAESRTTLMQLYLPLFVRVSTSAATNSFGDPQALIDDTVERLAAIRNSAVSLNKNRDQVMDAQYAVIAYIDETIARSQWDRKTEWNRQPLKALMSVDPNTGTKFFDKLSSWLQNPLPSKREVLEVYYVCLGLGFRGQYFEDQTKLNEIALKVKSEIVLSDHSPFRLSFSEYQQGRPIVGPADSFPWSWFVAGLSGFLLVVFLLLKWLSVDQLEDLANRLSP